MKYPRTYHLPFSPGASNDDKVMHDISYFIDKQLIITEKVDGSNVNITSKDCFARSHSGPPTHPSFDMLKAFHSSIKNLIPKDISIFGEWLYAKHSIHYDKLPSYLLIFAIEEGSSWLSCEDVNIYCEELGLTTVPFIGSQQFNSEKELENYIVKEAKKPSVCGGEREGLVIRVPSEFNNGLFSKSVAKYVRKNHVQTDEHWKNKEIERNKLATGC